MLLEGFRVRMYRSIRDSGFVPIFPLTALVGRDQSGKTSLLRALRGLDPDVDAPFSSDGDWPRGGRQPRRPEHVVCSAVFRFEEASRQQLVRRAAIGADARGVRVGRTCDGRLLIEEWDGEVADRLSKNEDSFTPGSAELERFVRDHLPRFLFAEHNSLLPGAVGGDALAAPTAADEETGVGALSRLLRSVGLSPDELRSGLTRRRVDEGGDRIRARLEERGLSRGFALDEERGRVTVLLEHGGMRMPADRLPRDRRFRLTLDLRLVATAEEPGRRPLLLLDGPGRSFHRAALGRMRALFDAYACDGAIVVYTSRMPFDIELQHSEQVLVLAPSREGAMVDPCRTDADPKLAVRAALGMTGRTSFTVDDLNLVVEGTSDARILRALDGLLRRSGEPGLPADVTVTSAQGAEEVVAVSAFLARQGLGVIALFDSDGAGTTGYERLRQAARGRSGMERLELLQLAAAAGLDGGNAAIEDLFPEDYYTDVARGVSGHDAEGLVARVSKGGGGNPAARFSRAFEASGRRFPKGRVIDALAERLAGMPSVDELPPGMASRVRHLMETIRSAADRLRVATVESTQGSGS